MTNSSLPDQEFRDRFASSFDENFSVIAPAGVGKTAAITDRIANFVIAQAQIQAGQPIQSLKMAAVTYTEKAAREIKERVFFKIAKSAESCPSLRATCFILAGSVFFGTIHSFATDFLKKHQGSINLPSTFEIFEDDKEIWQNFLKNFGDVLQIIPENIKKDFLCAYDIDDLLMLANSIKNPKSKNFVALTPSPTIDIEKILVYKTRANETKTKRFLKLLAEWADFKKNGDYYPIPDVEKICTSENFISFYQREMKNFLLWQADVVKFFTMTIAQHYKNFRISNGQLLYDDLINLATESLQLESVIANVELNPYRVILDEAQDTDLQQFRFLLGVSQRNLREGIAIDIQKNFPKQGYFSMVGDPQQSIYSSRADLTQYLGLHRLLIDTNSATELTFSVTMRCPPAVTQFINSQFPKIFTNVTFVPLIPCKNSSIGKVEIIKLNNPFECKSIVPQNYMTEIFSGKTPESFGVQVWSDIAILAPRKEWLLDIYKVFRETKNIPPVQLHFENCDNSFVKPLQWFAACLKYINNPADKREFAGILRELFGQTTQEIITHFRHGSSRVCTEIDQKFSLVRKKKYDMPLAKILMNILEDFKIFQRIQALGIYSQEELFREYKRTVELFYFAESEGMNIIEAEEFLIKNINKVQMSAKIDRNSLQFVTFHKSKGLEWPVVILPFMYRGRQLISFSTYGNLCDNENDGYNKFYDNECRLLYVACTRAKNSLYFIDDSDIFEKNLRTNMISSAKILYQPKG